MLHLAGILVSSIAGFLQACINNTKIIVQFNNKCIKVISLPDYTEISAVFSLSQ